jgi:cyanoexosortase B
MMQPLRLHVARQAWSELALLGLLGLLYIPLIIYWTQGWLNKSISIEHEYFSHGLIGLPYAIYAIWQNRRKWYALTRRTGRYGNIDRWAGFSFILLSTVMYLSGLPEAVNLSFPLILTGIVLWLKGIAGLRLMAWPLTFIWLATPNEIPYLIAPFTLPLQSFIASTAGIILNLLGDKVTVEGVHLFINGQHVEVAPYCAGLKMLFTSLYVALLLLHWSGTWRVRSIVLWLLGLTALISITGNIIRNTILTYFHGSGHTAAFQWLHEGWGGDMYSAMTLGLLVFVLNHLEYWFLISAPPINKT